MEIKETEPVFKDIEEYLAFSKKYKVSGDKAVKLKKQFDRILKRRY